jgi:Fungal specific transcription factor domain
MSIPCHRNRKILSKGTDRNVSSVDADLLIEAIEASETALGDKTVTHGPFSIFRLESDTPGDFQDLEEHSPVPASVDEEIGYSPGGVTEDGYHDMNPFEAQISPTIQRLNNVNGQQDVQNSTAFHSPTSTHEDGRNFTRTTDSYATTGDGDDDRNFDSNTPAQISQLNPVVSQNRDTTTLGSPPRISHLGFSFFHDQDRDTRHLMHHYFNTVTYLLQPITYPQNPYRTLYVPAALAGSSMSMSRANRAADVVNASVFHALLAASAFHLYSEIPSNADYYYSLGIRHRQIALQGVQRALASAMSTGQYRNLLIAILALVTIGVCLF